jgi:RNA-directed DNA polymerase
MILEPPESVQKLKAALQAKAKGSPGYRFYLLYDKLYRQDVLEYAYRCCKANHGAPGVDRQDFADIEAYGEERWLSELADKLLRKTYRAEAVRRVWIPKSGGKMRPLGIPCLADRTVMTAAVAVLAPIFEADMPDEQHGYRANFSAHTAVRSVHSLINTGHTQIIEGDLAGYFDSIPHAELLKSVARRVSDRHLLHLIKMWLDAPVEEDDGKGSKKRTTPTKDSGRGVPQGSPLSPLLGNLYMRRFVLGWKQRGVERKLRARIVSYADDYVICCKGSAVEAMTEMRWMMQRLKLTINEEKTRVCQLPQERFDFLGYTFGRCYSGETGRPIWARDRRRRASHGSLARFMSALTDGRRGRRPRTWSRRSMASSLAGRTTFPWVRSARLIMRSRSTPSSGCAGGCARSTRCRVPAGTGTLMSICIPNWGGSAMGMRPPSPSTSSATSSTRSPT